MLPDPLLPVPEEHLLPFPFISKRVVVCVKEHDRFLSCLAFKEVFRRVRVDGSLFHYKVLLCFFSRRMVGVDKVKQTYRFCVKSVDFICSVPLSRTVDTSEVKG